MKKKSYILIFSLFCIFLQAYSQENKSDAPIPVEIAGVGKDTILHKGAGSYWHYFQGKDSEAKKYRKDHPNEYKSTNNDPNLFVSENWDNYRIPRKQLDSIQFIIYQALPRQLIDSLPTIRERISFMILIKKDGRIICHSFMCSSRLISRLGGNTIYSIVNAIDAHAKVVPPAEYDLNYTGYVFPIIIPNLYTFKNKGR
ncbi:MAG: hypothetical protein LKI39_01535 [Bacteroides sp.]|jgi:hypothetical protein|nr:hypothetical protein [Bacteroides sp.]